MSSADAVDNLDSNSKLEEQVMRYVPNSPFVSVRADDGHHLCLGRYRLTDKPGLSSHEEVFALAESKSWELLMRVFAVLAATTVNEPQNT